MLEDTKDKLIVRTSYVASLGCGLLLSVRLATTEAKFIDNIHLPLIVFFLLLSNFLIKKYKNRACFTYFFTIYICTIHLYKVLVGGGFNSSQIQWYYLLSFAISTLYGFKKAVYYYMYHGFVLTSYALYMSQYQNSQTLMYAVQFFTISSTLLALFYYYDKVYATTQLQETKLLHSKRLENLRRGLLHEINNPLSVVLNISQIYATKDPTEFNEKLKSNSIRIKDVMDKVRNLDNLEDLEFNVSDKDS
jgi:hypothetical protein